MSPAPDRTTYVFERFYRGQNVRHLPGTGIGLASARLVVERHGGTIAVESQEGVGTTVTLRLPAATEDGVEQAMIGTPTPG